MGPENDATNVRSPNLRSSSKIQPTDTLTRGAKRGQILIMFAVMLTALLGAVGLSVDLGMAFSQRRTMQSAADAGAYAGAWAVLKTKAVQTEVNTVVNQNKMNFGTVTSIQCEFINDASQSLGGCSSAIPAGATGVRVTVTENHPTFFIKVVPGAPNNVTTSAVAAANIRKLTPVGGGPFLPCAQNALRADNGKPMTIVNVDANFNFVSVNPDAINVKFKIYGPSHKDFYDCGIKPADYNGAADPSNPCMTAPNWCTFWNGNKTGPVNQAVDGIDGCQKGVEKPYNCVAYLPVATEKGQPLPSNDSRVWVVGFLPFYIEQGPQPNKFYGTLLDDYILTGIGQDGQGGWTPDFQGPVSIRLTQ